MKLTFKPLTVTVVDILGTLLLGIVWLIVFLLLNELLFGKIAYPNTSVVEIIQNSLDIFKKTDKSVGITVFIIATASYALLKNIEK